MTRTRVHPEPPDEGSSPEPRWTPVVERTQSDNRLLGIFKSSFLRAMGTHHRSEQQIRTHEGSTSSSSPSSVLEPVWELCPTTRALPPPAPPTQPRLAFAVEAAGTNTQNVTCGCQVGVPLQPQLIGQIFPGPSAHCSNPCPVIVPFPVVPSHHRASRAGMVAEMEDKGNKVKKESQAGVKERDKETAHAAARLLQPGSERTSHSCSSAQKPKKNSKTSRGKDVAAQPLSSGWKRTSKAPPLPHKHVTQSSEQVTCHTWNNTVPSCQLSPQSRQEKLPPSKNTLAKESPLSHGGQPGSCSLILNCSSIQGKCACPHQFMSVADIRFRDPLHEPATTLISASALKPAARRNGTQSPPVRAAMDNNVESEGEESDSEDSSSDDEEDKAMDKLPPSDTNSHAAHKPSHITGNMDDQRLTYLQNMVLTTERNLELVREHKKDAKASYKKNSDQLGVRWRVFQQRKKFLAPELKRWIKEELRGQYNVMCKDWKRLKQQLKQEKADLRERLYIYKKDLKEEEKKEEQRQRALEKKRREKAKEEKLQQKKLQREEEKKRQKRLAQEKEEKKAEIARARVEEKRKEQLKKEEEKKLKRQREFEESMQKNNRRVTDRMSRYDRMCSWIRRHNPL